jgi:peptide chain release factor 1
MDELRIETTRGSGAGGQHKNVTDSCVIITHIPTGIKVVRDGRHQHKNKDEALVEIRERLNVFYLENHMNKVSKERKGQIGTGNRGSEKKRTYNQKMDLVIDHESDKSTSLKQFMKGKLELLMC